MSEPKKIRMPGRLVLLAPVAAETITIVADTDINTFTGYNGATESAGAALTMAAIATRQECGRNVVMTITDANSTVTGGYVKVYGMGIGGNSTSETLTIPGTGTATVTGSVPFVYISNATIWGVTGTAGSGDKIKIGQGAKLGLPMPDEAKLVAVVKERTGNANVEIKQSSVDYTNKTYTPGGTLNESNNVEIDYVYDLMINW